MKSCYAKNIMIYVDKLNKNVNRQTLNVIYKFNDYIINNIKQLIH